MGWLIAGCITGCLAPGTLTASDGDILDGHSYEAPRMEEGWIGGFCFIMEEGG